MKPVLIISGTQDSHAEHMSLTMREEGIKVKLNVMPEVVKGRRVIVIDDSIVRGTTSREIVQSLFRAGASEVHMRISSPPIKYPNYTGIDTPTIEQLIASNKTVEEVRDFIGATSLGYLSLEGLIKSIGVPEDQLDLSSFTGIYRYKLGTRYREQVAA